MRAIRLGATRAALPKTTTTASNGINAFYASYYLSGEAEQVAVSAAMTTF
jgi:hypothetical protein